MDDHLELERYPLDNLQSDLGKQLISRCRHELNSSGLFNLDQFIKLSALDQCIEQIDAIYNTLAFTHAREHNIYFDDSISDIDASHPALKRMHTINHTICADQLVETLLYQIYRWPALVNFLASVLGKRELFPMADPLAQLNVMYYHEGEALNWHFDRAEFTVTLLLSAPLGGGLFEVSNNIRSDTDPCYEEVGDLLAGKRGLIRRVELEPGTLNVFLGKNSAHRITPVKGKRPRIVAVLSFCETPNFCFTDEDRKAFYGRSRSFTWNDLQ